jgi:hypothetical protein
MENRLKSIEKGEIILYQPDNTVTVEVRLEGDDVWLNRQQIAALFDRDVKTIGKHINNALKEELASYAVVAKFATTATDGKIYQVEHYNLDMILSVGYRVKSIHGIRFRIWANSILRDYVTRGYAVNQRFEHLENRVSETENKIDFFIKTSLPPVQGIFFDGQIFDAYALASKIIKSAKTSIKLIDNYIDESVLTILSKKSNNVKVILLTKNISKKLELDIDKFNQQYPPIEAKVFNCSHDRFLIIDDMEVYHLGASLKDLGKKWFAFSKINIDGLALLDKIGKV